MFGRSEIVSLMILTPVFQALEKSIGMEPSLENVARAQLQNSHCRVGALIPETGYAVARSPLTSRKRIVALVFLASRSENGAIDASQNHQQGAPPDWRVQFRQDRIRRMGPLRQPAAQNQHSVDEK